MFSGGMRFSSKRRPITDQRSLPHSYNVFARCKILNEQCLQSTVVALEKGQTQLLPLYDLMNITIATPDECVCAHTTHAWANRRGIRVERSGGGP